jgi:hypothetical protein
MSRRDKAILSGSMAAGARSMRSAQSSIVEQTIKLAKLPIPNQIISPREIISVIARRPEKEKKMTDLSDADREIAVKILESSFGFPLLTWEFVRIRRRL